MLGPDDLPSRKKFSQQVIERVTKTGGSYMDHIIELCEELGIPIEDSKKFLTANVKGEVELEARALNMLVGEGTDNLEELM